MVFAIYVMFQAAIPILLHANAFPVKMDTNSSIISALLVKVCTVIYAKPVLLLVNNVLQHMEDFHQHVNCVNHLTVSIVMETIQFVQLVTQDIIWVEEIAINAKPTVWLAYQIHNVLHVMQEHICKPMDGAKLYLLTVSALTQLLWNRILGPAKDVHMAIFYWKETAIRVELVFST